MHPTMSAATDLMLPFISQDIPIIAIGSYGQVINEVRDGLFWSYGEGNLHMVLVNVSDPGWRLVRVYSFDSKYI